MRKYVTAAAVILAAGMLAGCGKSETGLSGTSSARQSGTFPEFPVKNEQKYKRISTCENNMITDMETEIFDDHDNCVYWNSMGSEMFQAYEYNRDGGEVLVKCVQYNYTEL